MVAACITVEIAIMILILSTTLWYPGIFVIFSAAATLIAICLLGTILEMKVIDIKINI